MKKIKFLCIALVAVMFFSSHDMFLKFNSYFLQPNSEAVLQLFNGTFEKSDNSIDRDRMQDVSLVSNGKRTSIGASQWFVKDSITFLNFKTGNAGTQVVGVSTKPRDFEMEAKKFNDYLKNDGVVDILENRKANDKLNDDAFEKYSKHVKTIFQVGDKLTDDWNVNLGYPIEFVPLENPYEIHSGHNFPVKLLLGGKPLANHYVYVGYKPNNNLSHSPSHKHGKDTHSHDDEVHTHNADNKVHEHKHNGESHSHSDAKAHSHGDESHSHVTEEHTHGNSTEKAHNHNENSAASHSHETDENEDHEHDKVSQLKTDENGVVTVDINAEGTWFLRTIHMTELEDEKLTHESNWATLTFGVGAGLGHSHDDVHSHEDEHEHDTDGFPSYVFWIGSVILVSLLFFLFNRKK